MTDERKLFKLCKKFEGFHENFHIINQTDKFGLEEKYRIYHWEGYCFEVKREYFCEESEVKKNIEQGVDDDGFIYIVVSQFDNFKALEDVMVAVKMFDDLLKLN